MPSSVSLYCGVRIAEVLGLRLWERKHAVIWIFWLGLASPKRISICPNKRCYRIALSVTDSSSRDLDVYLVFKRALSESDIDRSP